MVRQTDLKELPAEIEVEVDGKIRRMRTGFTTGACAAAASKASVQVLVKQIPVTQVEITLPLGHKVKFQVETQNVTEGEATCSVIKDAGDDPDVTHGAKIIATVSWCEKPGVLLEAGEGVGVVTKPGLGLPVGEPAINAVPRKMITSSIREVLGEEFEERGVRVRISIPNGRELAKKTLNERLGIVGGLSILGITGIVMPYSTSSWMATIAKGIDVTLASGYTKLVATTGDKSEEFAREVLDLPEHAFLQMGEFVGFTIRQAQKKGATKLILGGMIGKLTKTAAGVFQTHAAASQIDIGFLVNLASELGASAELLSRLKKANTARHVQELVLEGTLEGFFDRVCQKVCEKSRDYVGGKLQLGCVLFDFDGKVLGSFNVDEWKKE